MTIKEIEAREKAATPGPWEFCAPPEFKRPEDKEFAEHAREDIPHLLAQLRDREEKLAAVKLFVDLNLGPKTRQRVARIL